MLVEFLSVVSDMEEQREKAIQEDIVGEGSTSPYNKNDKLYPTIIDMKLGEGWECTYTFFNEQRKSCIVAVMKGGFFSRALLAEPEDFKNLYAMANGSDVYPVESLLKSGI